MRETHGLMHRLRLPFASSRYLACVVPWIISRLQVESIRMSSRALHDLYRCEVEDNTINPLFCHPAILKLII